MRKFRTRFRLFPEAVTYDTWNSHNPQLNGAVCRRLSSCGIILIPRTGVCPPYGNCHSQPRKFPSLSTDSKRKLFFKNSETIRLLRPRDGLPHPHAYINTFLPHGMARKVFFLFAVRTNFWVFWLWLMVQARNFLERVSGNIQCECFLTRGRAETYYINHDHISQGENQNLYVFKYIYHPFLVCIFHWM